MTFAADTFSAVVRLGGRFMTSPDMTARGAELGLADRLLYFRGRAGVLGTAPPVVVTQVLGIFPAWIIDYTWENSAGVTPEQAVTAYAQGCWDWGRNHLTGTPEAVRTARLAHRVVDAADGSALPLFTGWRAARRPYDTDGPAALAHALMLLRELRGGLHFGALRACGLGVTEAVVADPGGGRARLLRTAWPEDEADALVARAGKIPDLTERWRRAERLTEDAFDRAVAATLPEAELVELRERLVALG
ncbi:SCO6745 family protein [Streptomyces sp. 8N616]|uniref:SCO6745 family protein n=1 Tax=Streptomyces sp. 8N616 TaxID=3457414 RepID=UPI003FD3ABFF